MTIRRGFGRMVSLYERAPLRQLLDLDPIGAVDWIVVALARVFCQTTCIGIAASDMSDNTWINAAIRLSRPSDQETYRTEPKHAYRISNTQTGLRRALGRAQQLSNRVGHPWGMVHSFHYAYPLFSPLVGYYFPSIFNFWNKIFTRSFDPATKTGLRLL